MAKLIIPDAYFAILYYRVWLRLSTRLEAILTSPAVVEVDAVEGVAEDVEEEEVDGELPKIKCLNSPLISFDGYAF